MKFNWGNLPRFVAAIILAAIFTILLCEEFGFSRATAVPFALFICVQLQSRGIL
jgi:hypothetical protein